MGKGSSTDPSALEAGSFLAFLMGLVLIGGFTAALLRIIRGSRSKGDVIQAALCALGGILFLMLSLQNRL